MDGGLSWQAEKQINHFNGSLGNITVTKATFIKYGDPEALRAEVDGLAALKTLLKQHEIPISTPDVLALEGDALTLGHIKQTQADPNQWHAFGQALAQMHLIEQPLCGWQDDNWIGLNLQKNVLCDDWGLFFVEHRLQTQIDWIKDPQQRSLFQQQLNKVRSRLIDWLNAHCRHFSLLHGDLWAGNVMFDSDQAFLIDPAVYWGDAETDLAMTELFGGFSKAFYQGYQSLNPLSPVYPLKRTIYNLYHQLNHYNLFGGGYLNNCLSGMSALRNIS